MVPHFAFMLLSITRGRKVPQAPFFNVENNITTAPLSIKRERRRKLSESKQRDDHEETYTTLHCSVSGCKLGGRLKEKKKQASDNEE
ncbi:CLUMA_CG001020, isoform A [Clunio marinus]|uniref:CLUMA_CG001020, isoform A n=1 Tax=Clunio marinus TaxID=568069 RepID=A0A1J1HGS0_9DIPT|nr:CLUMA_CG001020, isoform A [Clunio marinus]